MINDGEGLQLRNDVVGGDEAELQQLVVIVAGVDDRQALKVETQLWHGLEKIFKIKKNWTQFLKVSWTLCGRSLRTIPKDLDIIMLVNDNRLNVFPDWL
jgi:hypothetical protein